MHLFSVKSELETRLAKLSMTRYILCTYTIRTTRSEVKSEIHVESDRAATPLGLRPSSGH